MANTTFGAFSAVDLSKLPAPQAVEQLDYEAILTGMSQDFQQRMADVWQDIHRFAGIRSCFQESGSGCLPGNTRQAKSQ